MSLTFLKLKMSGVLTGENLWCKIASNLQYCSNWIWLLLNLLWQLKTSGFCLLSILNVDVCSTGPSAKPPSLCSSQWGVAFSVDTLTASVSFSIWMRPVSRNWQIWQPVRLNRYWVSQEECRNATWWTCSQQFFHWVIELSCSWTTREESRNAWDLVWNILICSTFGK